MRRDLETAAAPFRGATPAILLVSTATIAVYPHSCLFIDEAVHLSRIATRDFFYRQPCGLFKSANSLRAILSQHSWPCELFRAYITLRLQD
jgi:hypothetical protein